MKNEKKVLCKQCKNDTFKAFEKKNLNVVTSRKIIFRCTECGNERK